MICKVLQLSIGAWLPKGGVVFKVTESLVRESLVTYESARKGGEEEDMETETHTNGFSFWNEFQSLTERLSALGLRDQFLSHSTVLAIENKVGVASYNYIHGCRSILIISGCGYISTGEGSCD